LFTVLAVALLATFTAALPSQAEFQYHTNTWNTNFWPAAETPPRKRETPTNIVFQSDAISSNLIFALVERHEAALLIEQSFAEDMLALIPRRPDTVLQQIKDRTKELLPFYLDHTRFGTNQTSTDPRDAIITNLIYWEVSTIAEHLEIPIDFFDKTPPRNLTEQEGTGSAHWTNSIGYGWDSMRKVMTNLIYTFQTNGFLPDQVDFYQANGYGPPRSEQVSFPPDRVLFRVGPWIYDTCFTETNNTTFTVANWTITNFIDKTEFTETMFDVYEFLAVNQTETLFFSTYSKEFTSGYPAYIIGNPFMQLTAPDLVHTSYVFILAEGGVGYSEDNLVIRDVGSVESDCDFLTTSNKYEFYDIIDNQHIQIADSNFVARLDTSVDVTQPDCELFIFLANLDFAESIFASKYLGCYSDVYGEVGPPYGKNLGWERGLTTAKIPAYIIDWDFRYE
jgi:hypothetical protein